MTGSFGGAPAWLADFDLPDAPTGAVIAVDIEATGLWAGRVEDGAVVESQTESRIHPDVLDARIAAYLRDSGQVQTPTPEAFGELVVVVGRGRQALVGHDSSLTMGFEHLRLVRLGLDDVIEATVRETNRAHGMIVELAGTDPVDAVLLGPGHSSWPGLWEALTERGFSVLLPGDDFPVTFGGDEQPTELIAPVSGPQVIRAWEGEDAGPASVDPADYGPDRFGPAEPDVYTDEQAPAAAPEPGMRGRLLVLGVLILMAVGGGGVALAMNAHEASGPERDVAETTSSAPTSNSSTSEPERVPSNVDPRDLEAARAPVSSYTTPPPPSKSTKPRQSEARPGPKPPEPTRPKRRTIPNPIPGLPPIVIG